MSYFAYSKRKCIGDFFREQSGLGFGGVYWFGNNVRRVSGIVGRPNANTDTFLVSCGDLKFGVSYKGVEGFVPTDKEPRVVDEF
jgi:hypothetical protein